MAAPVIDLATEQCADSNSVAAVDHYSTFHALHPAYPLARDRNEMGH